MDVENPDQVCAECLKETHIEYKYRGGFFKPRLKGINYLEVGRSKIISNPITIFIEYLYIFYKKIRNAWRKFCKWLFPRRQTIKPQKKADSHIVGRVIFAQRGTGQIPIHNLKVEFWARRWWFFQWRKISEGYSDNDGYFKLPFYLRAARRPMNYHLQVEFYQTTHVYFKNESPEPAYELAAKISFSKKELIGMSYNLRTVPLQLWEYRPDSAIPRVVYMEANGRQTLNIIHRAG